MQLCEATRIDEPIPVFRHREAMAKGNKEGIRTSDHQRAIAQLKIGTNGLKQSGVSPFDATRVLSHPNRSEDERSRPDRA